MQLGSKMKRLQLTMLTEISHHIALGSEVAKLYASVLTGRLCMIKPLIPAACVDSHTLGIKPNPT